jgi:hypothetical protein
MSFEGVSDRYADFDVHKAGSLTTPVDSLDAADG